MLANQNTSSKVTTSPGEATTSGEAIRSQTPVNELTLTTVKLRRGKPASTRLKSSVPSSGWGLVTLAGLLGLWQLLAMLEVYPQFVLPAPASVAERWWQEASNGNLWKHVGTTASEALLGLGLALLVTAVLCYPLAHSRLMAALLNPLLATSQAIPVLAVAPLLVIWFGFGITPKIITCALIVFFPLLLNTVSGLRNIEKSLLEAAEIFGAGRWQNFWQVELPLSLPAILTGVKISVTVSITGAVVGEFISANAGLGYLLNLGRGSFDTTLVFVALFTLTAMALLGYGLVTVVEKRAVSWQ